MNVRALSLVAAVLAGATGVAVGVALSGDAHAQAPGWTCFRVDAKGIYVNTPNEWPGAVATADRLNTYFPSAAPGTVITPQLDGAGLVCGVP